jgi:hypothetical protein
MAEKQVADSILKDDKAKDAGPNFGAIFESPDKKAKPAEAAPATVTADKTGEAKAPPPETKAAETTPKATDSTTAVPKDVASVTTDKVGAPVVTDAADKPKVVDPEVVKGLALSKEVARILDNDVPAANQERKLDVAEAAYNRAIEIAKQVTPEQIAKAKVEYDEVLKAKLTEKDPEKLRALADRQAELYSLTRVKDAALGNMALWYYRQGKVEEGTAKFLEAAGLKPEDAQALKQMTPEQVTKLADTLDGNAPILTDVNFMAQYSRIKESGQPLPEDFIKIHSYLREQQEKLAAQQKDAATTTADTQAGTPQANLEKLANAFDKDANQKALQDFTTTAAEVQKGDGKITEAQDAILKAGVKAADDRFDLIKAAYEVNQSELDKLVPPEKQEAFKAATDKVSTELANMIAKGPKDAAGNPSLSPEDMGLLSTVANLNNSVADRDAARAKLNTAHPEFGKAMDEALNIVGKDANGSTALGLYFASFKLGTEYQSAAADKVTQHYIHSSLLDKSGDKAQAKAVLESGFAGVPAEVSKVLLETEEVKKLATSVGADLAAAAATTTDQATAPTDAAPAALSADNPILKDFEKKYPGMTLEHANTFAQATPQQLLEYVHGLHAKGSDSVPEAKLVYDVLLQKLESPERINSFKADLTAKLTAMEKDQTIDGKPLDAATRLQYHKDNRESINAMADSVMVRQEYAAYLGGKDATKFDPKHPENMAAVRAFADGQMDLNKSMEEQLQGLYKAADSMPTDLIKREEAQLNKSLGTIGASDPESIIAGGLDFINGNKQDPGIIDIGVSTRTRAAMMYVSQGATFNKEKGVFEMAEGPKDEMYQPTKAIALLKEADAKYKAIHGANATDPDLERVKVIGAQLDPEKFKALTEVADRKLWSNGANLASGLLAMGTEIGVLALTRNSRMGVAARHALSTAGAMTTATAGRALIMRAGTGEWESGGETLANAAGVTAFVSGMKYAGMGGKALLNTKAVQQFENIGLSARRFEQNVHPGITLGEYGERLAAKGMNVEAQTIAKSDLAGKKIADLTDDQLRAVVPKEVSTRGLEAIIKLETNLNPALKAIQSLEKQGISTVGDLKGIVQKNYDEAQDFVKAAKDAGLSPKLNYRQAMEELGKLGNPRFNSAAKIETELANLNTGMKSSMFGSVEAIPVLPKVGKFDGRAIPLPQTTNKTIGQLETYIAKATPETEVARLYPGLVGQADDVTLRAVEQKSPDMFGKLSEAKINFSARPQGWKQLEGIAPEIGDITARVGFRQSAKEILLTNRFYSGIGLGKSAPEFADATKLAGAMQRRDDLVAFSSFLLANAGYKSITGVYDKMGKGVDEQGNAKQYTFGEALTEANFGTTNPTAIDVVTQGGVLEALFAGAAFKGLIKAGTAESSSLSVKAALGQLGKNPTSILGPGVAVGTMPAFQSGVTTWMGKQQLTPFVIGADRPQTDYGYDWINPLGTEIAPNAGQDSARVAPADTTTAAPADTTTAAPVDTTTVAPADTTGVAPVDTSAKAPPAVEGGTETSKIVSPDEGP